MKQTFRKVAKLIEREKARWMTRRIEKGRRYVATILSVRIRRLWYSIWYSKRIDPWAACARSLRDCGYRQWQQAPREAWLGTARTWPPPFNADPPTGPENKRNAATKNTASLTECCVTGHRHCCVESRVKTHRSMIHFGLVWACGIGERDCRMILNSRRQDVSNNNFLNYSLSISRGRGKRFWEIKGVKFDDITLVKVEKGMILFARSCKISLWKILEKMFGSCENYSKNYSFKYEADRSISLPESR